MSQGAMASRLDLYIPLYFSSKFVSESQDKCCVFYNCSLSTVLPFSEKSVGDDLHSSGERTGGVQTSEEESSVYLISPCILEGTTSVEMSNLFISGGLPASELKSL